MQPKMNRHWRCPANFYNRDGTYRFNIYIFWEVTHDWLPVPTVSRDLILFSSLGKSSFQGLKKTTTRNWDELVGWLVGLVAINFISPSQLGIIISSQLTNSYIFQRGGLQTTNQLGIQSLGGTVGTIGARFGHVQNPFLVDVYIGWLY